MWSLQLRSHMFASTPHLTAHRLAFAVLPIIQQLKQLRAIDEAFDICSSTMTGVAPSHSFASIVEQTITFLNQQVKCASTPAIASHNYIVRFAWHAAPRNTFLGRVREREKSGFHSIN
jgi:hypothetical protein